MIIWADGFDHYGTSDAGDAQMLDGVYAAINNGSIVNTISRTGTCSFECVGNNGRFRRVFGSALVTCGIAMAINLSALPVENQSCTPFIYSDSGNNPQVTIMIETTGIVSVWLGNGLDNYGTKLASSSTLVAAASWNHIESKVHFDDSAGAVEVRLNGVTIINVSGVQTVNAHSPASGELSASQVTVGQETNDSSFNMYVDDLILWDTSGTYNNDFVGDLKVFTDMPNADTADKDWTPLSGSATYPMIDEIPADGDTSYIESITTGDKSGVTFPALDAAVTSVAAVLFYAKTRKTDAGTANAQVSVVSGGVAQAGADNPITTQYTYRWDVFEVDPNTAAPWDPTAAGAASMVIERTA